MSSKRTLELAKKHLDKVLELIEEDDGKAEEGCRSLTGSAGLAREGRIIRG